MTHHLSKGVKPETLEISKEIVDLGISITVTTIGNYSEVIIGDGDIDKIQIIEKYFQDMGLTTVND
tara:strand:- start:709 stop:906 length:198 start_codon:yes stop_codon:yes gene_type:complete